MKDQEFIQAYSERLVAGDFEGMQAAPEGGMRGRLTDLIAQLIQKAREAGLTWGKLFAVSVEIYRVISSGGSFEDMIAAIWKVLFPQPNPPPVPTINIP